MKAFSLKMTSSNKRFFDGEIISLKINLNDGGYEILAGHADCIFIAEKGIAAITLPDGKKEYFLMGTGVADCDNGEVKLLSDTLVWEKDIDEFIANREMNINRENERRKQSYQEYKMSTVELAKTFAKLKDKTTELN